MSWLFSQALVAGYSEASSSDGERSAPSSESRTPQAFLPSDRMTDFYRPSQSGMTFGPLTENLGADVLTWFLGGFHAKTLAQPAEVLESVGREADFGWKWPASFARWDLDLCSWKTRQCSLVEGLEEFSETWPAWGSMRNGECLERISSMPPTLETEFGYWPTPQASDGMRARMKVESFQKVHADSRGGRSYLARVLAHEFGLPQSAEFTEWLMIWPEGWTDLKPLETAKYREWLRQHSLC